MSKPTWQVPIDFKPAFYNITFITDSDGLLTKPVRATFIKARTTEEIPLDAKADRGMLTAIGNRIAATILVPASRRLQPDTVYCATYYVSEVRSSGAIRVAINTVSILQQKRMVELTKDDADYKLLRKGNQILPAAFIINPR